MTVIGDGMAVIGVGMAVIGAGIPPELTAKPVLYYKNYKRMMAIYFKG